VTTRLYLMRHAETATPNVFHGAESDIHLSDRGHEQARAVATLLRDLGPAKLISSPMLRARQTAASIAEACGLSPRIEPDLHERKVGALQGTPNRPETGLWPDTLARWIAGETHHAPDSSESWDQVQGRAMRVLNRLVQEAHPGPIALVAHGLLLKVSLLTITGEGPAGWQSFGPIRNTEIFTVDHSPAGWRLIAKPPLRPGGGP
jgi:broad specificity phosphatase PhoE